jgi:creatinine amidohydrolase
MGAAELDRMTWPEVRAEQQAGRDTVVIAFGATEQHGPHLPLATDAIIGDHLARLVAARLNAFVAHLRT